MAYSTDDEVIKALRNQNQPLFSDLDLGEHRLSIRNRRRARNPQTAGPHSPQCVTHPLGEDNRQGLGSYRYAEGASRGPEDHWSSARVAWDMAMDSSTVKDITP